VARFGVRGTGPQLAVSLAGWTTLAAVVNAPASDGLQIAYRIAQTGDPAAMTFSMGTGCSGQNRGTVAEYSGLGTAPALDVTNSAIGNSAAPSITFDPTDGSETLLLAAAIQNNSAGGPDFTPANSETEVDDLGTDGAFNPGCWLAYKVVNPSTGTYTLGATTIGSGSWAIYAISFVAGNAAVPGVWMDFDGDGFESDITDNADAPLARMMPQLATAGISDDVTTRCLSLTWNRGGSYDHQGQDGPGGATITLNNYDGRFDPDNVAGPLYGKLVPGIPVWVGVVQDTWFLSGAGTVKGIFGGYVKTWSPTVDHEGRRVVEVICEDALGRYRRVPVSVAPSLSRSHGALRAAILDAAGEASARRSLEAEAGMLPISAVDAADALSVLEELNQATASRHFIAPADTKEAWYTYTVVNKLHALDSAASETINADDVTDVSGWTVTDENLIEQQRAQVTPIRLSQNNVVVWTYDGVPLTITTRGSRTIWATFSDYVFDATISSGVTEGSITTLITNFGKTAKIVIFAQSATATIGLLQVLGRIVVRGDAEQVIAGSTNAGARAGSLITSDYVGQPGAGQGLVDFIVWKFGTRLKRPSFTMAGDTSTTKTTLATRDLYDVVNLVVDKLSVTSRRLEIIGLDGTLVPGHFSSVTYRTQETPNQTAVHYFTVGVDSVGSSVPVAPF
jgi:hypothetical protein